MNAYLYGGLALLVVGLGIATWGQSKRIDVLNAQNAGLRADLSTAAQANDAQKQTITDLQDANDKWANLAKRDEKAHAEALEALSKANLARDKAQAAMRLREQEDRSSVACQQLLKIDVSRVCPEIARDMLERAK